MKKWLKLICLALFCASTAAILLTDNRVIQTAHGYSSGPPSGFTGAPGEVTCVACHSGSLNSGPGTFTIIAPSTYMPGQTYPITVMHANNDKIQPRLKWGFQLTALNTAQSQAGTLQETATTLVLSDAGQNGDRQYIEHNAGGTFEGQVGGASWTFNWVAPQTNIGPVTLFAAGNQADGDFTNDGDQIYSAQATINPAAICSYTISPTSKFVSVSGGDGNINITSAAGCNWTAASNDDWIMIVSASAGSGNGQVSFEVRENFTASPRQGTLNVAGQTFTVIQDAGLGDDCQYTISPQFTSFSAGGGSGSVEVFTEERCAWEATSNVSWIVITANPSGIGSNTVQYSVAPNTSTSGRKGIITVAGKIFAVKQKAAG